MVVTGWPGGSIAGWAGGSNVMAGWAGGSNVMAGWAGGSNVMATVDAALASLHTTPSGHQVSRCFACDHVSVSRPWHVAL